MTDGQDLTRSVWDLIEFDRTGKERIRRIGKDREGEDKKKQERTGKDRIGQERVGLNCKFR